MLIVLGGGIMVQPYIINRIRENLPKYLMPNCKDVKLVNLKLGNNAGTWSSIYGNGDGGLKDDSKS